MKNNKINLFTLLLTAVLLTSCGKETKKEQEQDLTPKVTNNGTEIVFPAKKSADFFESETIDDNVLNAKITAPATVAATVVSSQEGAAQNIVLFENPELASNYTQLFQHLININQIKNKNIRQKQIELDRVKDLQAHGAATGRDLLEAQTLLSMEETNLANEKAAIIEHEAKLKAGGFEPSELKRAAAGTSFVICDVPENELSEIKKGSSCIVQFTAFPNETFNGKVDAIADMTDETTRMVKLRITLNNNGGKFKAGMFATVSFGISQGKNINVNKTSIITIQAKNYVFIKKNDTTFERREVTIGDQVGDRIIIFSGLEKGETVAVKGVMQLKGLSFGY
jgi:cobalt-zinc-cadmium efflux system membrane fusion protein